MARRAILWPGRRAHSASSARPAEPEPRGDGDARTGELDPSSRRRGRRETLLGVLRDSDVPLSVADLASRIGVHPNTARFHLDALLRRGQVERGPDPDPRPGRPRVLYRVRAGMDPAGPRRYMTLAAVLVDGLAGSHDGAARATQAGRSWGARIEPPPMPGPASHPRDRAVQQLVGLLDGYGFEPRIRSDADDVVELWHCPFLELAQESPDVVCPAHLGIMQGALEAWRAPLTVDRLDSFAAPGRCLAHLTPIGDER